MLVLFGIRVISLINKEDEIGVVVSSEVGVREVSNLNFEKDVDSVKKEIKVINDVEIVNVVFSIQKIRNFQTIEVVQNGIEVVKNGNISETKSPKGRVVIFKEKKENVNLYSINKNLKVLRNFKVNNIANVSKIFNRMV